MNDKVQEVFEAEFDLKKNTVQSMLSIYKNIDNLIKKILLKYDEEDYITVKVDQFNKKIYVTVTILDRSLN